MYDYFDKEQLWKFKIKRIQNENFAPSNQTAMIKTYF